MKKLFRNFSHVQIIAVGFCVLILLGTLALMLPFSSVGEEKVSFLDALFTATSASCVTGLVTLDTGTVWSGFGQGVILFLIQIGGLGFMTIATFFFILFLSPYQQLSPQRNGRLQLTKILLLQQPKAICPSALRLSGVYQPQGYSGQR